MTYISEVGLLLVTFAVVTTAMLVPEEASFNITCVADSECVTRFGSMAACLDVNVTSSGSTKSCACDPEKQYFKRPGDIAACWYKARLGEQCSDDGWTFCAGSYTVCDVSGDLYHTKRCQCDVSTISVRHNQQTLCATPITSQTDPTCETCEQNMGRCYDTDGDRRRDGCHCPISLTGDDCQIVHVFVNCTVDDFKMAVCYDPHDGVNLTAGARMHTEHHGTDIACRGVPDEDRKCEQGTYRLELPLADNKRDRCGTVKHQSSTSIKYENRIYVNQGTELPGDYIMFKTYCLFQTHAVASFNGMGVFALADGWAGQDSEPDVRLTIRRAVGDELRPGMFLQVGDQVNFRVSLDPSGDYGGVLVENCIFSPTYSTYDPRGQTVAILQDSCPVSGQSFLNAYNNWRITDPLQPFRVDTGLVAPPMLRSGTTTYLHCTVKLCLRGDLGECRPKPCNAGKVTEHQSAGRRKRSSRLRRRRATPDISDKSTYLELSGTIQFADPSLNIPVTMDTSGKAAPGGNIVMNKILFVVGATVTFVLLVTLFVTTSLLTMRELRRARTKTSPLHGRTRGNRPPLFSLPSHTTT